MEMASGERRLVIADLDYRLFGEDRHDAEVVRGEPGLVDGARPAQKRESPAGAAGSEVDFGGGGIGKRGIRTLIAGSPNRNAEGFVSERQGFPNTMLADSNRSQHVERAGEQRRGRIEFALDGDCRRDETGGGIDVSQREIERGQQVDRGERVNIAWAGTRAEDRDCLLCLVATFGAAALRGESLREIHAGNRSRKTLFYSCTDRFAAEAFGFGIFAMDVCVDAAVVKRDSVGLSGKKKSDEKVHSGQLSLLATKRV